MNNSRWFNILKKLLLLITLINLSACEEEKSGVQYFGVNYTDNVIDGFTINGAGGVVNLFPHSGGGKFACCVMLPKHWSPELTATIRWRRGPDINVLREQTVKIPEYDKPHQFGVYFFTNDKVEVLVANSSPGYPNNPYPFPDPQDCWDGVTNTCKEGQSE